MHAALSVFFAFISLLLPAAASLAQSDADPPTESIFAEDFSPIRPSWQPVSGAWSVINGTYASSSSGSSDISIVTSYDAIHATDPPDTHVRYPDFTVRARMRNLGFDDADLVGLVYGYQDPQNYYEVVVSALGTVRMRTVMGGIAVDEVPAATPNIPRNTWFEVEVRWNHGVAALKINGNNFFTVSQPEFTTGRIGLVTHSTVARFDKVSVIVPFGDLSFLEMFDEAPFVAFTPQSGQWAVTDGTYRNSAVQQTSITLAPIHTGAEVKFGETVSYTFRAQMLNPYGASGNLVGIVFNYEGNSRYSEVVFSPTGVARVNRVEGGVITTLATANYGGRPNVPFDVALENQPNDVSVVVNGVRLFETVPFGNPNMVPEGGVGLITHWAPGRFDNVEFDHGVFEPCSVTFDDGQPGEIVSGTWNTTGGTLNSTAVGQSDIVDFNFACPGNTEGDDEGTDAVFSARLLNEYGASGNLVGLIYNYQRSGLYAGDYFEVVFSPTGIMQINKFIQGVRYPVATGTHTIPRNTWFDVQVVRVGIFTDVRVNGTTVLQLVRQGELRGGGIGVITHWSKGRFDNVVLTPRVSRPPSEL
jgi:hypothetical protein